MVQSYAMKEARARLKEILTELSILRGKFTLASGKESDYYIDARLTTLNAEGVSLIAELFLLEIGNDKVITAVGGPTMGADPIVGAMLNLSHQRSTSQRSTPLKGFLVRKAEKGHGTGKLIEGNLTEGDVAVIVEDVATTGGSIMRAVNAVKGHGATVKKALVVVDREEGASSLMGVAGCEFYSIFKVSELL